MKKITLALGVIALLSTAVIAGPNSSGAYVGLGYGVTEYYDDGWTSSVDKSDSGYKLYGGYQFNNIIGVEASYTDYGSFTDKVTNSEYVSPTTFSVAANAGYSFLDGQLRPFGILGLGYASVDYDTSSIDSGNTGTVHYGVGVQYEPTILKGVGFRLAYEADLYLIETIVPSKTYEQVFDLLYLGVQYKF